MKKKDDEEENYSDSFEETKSHEDIREVEDQNDEIEKFLQTATGEQMDFLRQSMSANANWPAFKAVEKK